MNTLTVEVNRLARRQINKVVVASRVRMGVRQMEAKRAKEEGDCGAEEDEQARGQGTGEVGEERGGEVGERPQPVSSNFLVIPGG